MSTVKERRQAKAIKRSRRNSPAQKTVVKSEKDIERLRKYKLKQILFRKF